jgi:hypothetical protein
VVYRLVRASPPQRFGTPDGTVRLTGWGVRSFGVGGGQTGFVEATLSSLYKGHRFGP